MPTPGIASVLNAEKINQVVIFPNVPSVQSRLFGVSKPKTANALDTGVSTAYVEEVTIGLSKDCGELQVHTTILPLMLFSMSCLVYDARFIYIQIYIATCCIVGVC